jgi:hypothetical protein
MSDRERENIGAPIIKRASQYKSSQFDLDHFHAARTEATAQGLAIYSHGQPQPSNYWQPFERLYPRQVPTLHGWTNHLAHTGSAVASFAEFAAYMGQTLPAGEFALSYYLGATSRDIFRRRDVPRMMTYEELLGILWDDPKTKYSLVKSPAFAYVRSGDAQLVDDAGRPWLAFRPEGFNDYWLDV